MLVCASKSTVDKDSRSTQNVHSMLTGLSLDDWISGISVVWFVVYNEIFSIRERVVEYVWNITLISMNLDKTDSIQFMFTYCPHSLTPNCSYKGHLTLAETGSGLAYQSFVIPKHHTGRFPGAARDIPAPPTRTASGKAGIPRPLPRGPPGDLHQEVSRQASFLASR